MNIWSICEEDIYSIVYNIIYLSYIVLRIDGSGKVIFWVHFEGNEQ